MKSAFATALLVFVLVSCSVTTYVPARTAAKFYDQGDYVNAIQYYMKAVADRDQRAETFYGLGMSFYRHGDLEEAMLALERSFEKDSSDVVVIERLALVNLDLGNIQKAGTYSHKAVHLDNEFAEAYNTLGHVFFEGGELDSAEYTSSPPSLFHSLCAGGRLRTPHSPASKKCRLKQTTGLERSVSSAVCSTVPWDTSMPPTRW